ncbi:hypothetical protein [uncultured Methanolobus sp.]|uniref:hypothetical protein n=1 Tax=uncultured Methanolobus sp. TaxID=218300 RepID=UPI002AAB2A23|nr:hypothetical protein [uncultured Methanolobus sp.]
MKLRKTSKEETKGIIVGTLISFIYLLNISDLLIVFPVLFTYQEGYSQMGYWIKLGPMFFFIFTFVYIAARKVIDEERKTEYVVSIKSSIIGFFVWLAVLTLAYLLDVKVGYNANISGGLFTILLVYLYMKKAYIRRIKVICRGYDV